MQEEKTEKIKVLFSFVGNRDPLAKDRDEPRQEYFPPKREGGLFKLRKAFTLFSSRFGLDRQDHLNEKKPQFDLYGETNEGGIVSICRRYQPSKIFLFPSRGIGSSAPSTCGDFEKDFLPELFPVKQSRSAGEQPRDTDNQSSNTEINAMAVRQFFKERNTKRIYGNFDSETDIHILPLELEDATGFEEISEKFYEKIEGLLDETFEVEDCDFYINCSSGTPQMQAIACLFANTGRIPGIKCIQSKDPNRLKKGEPRVREIKTTFLDERYYIKRIRALLGDFDFHSAALLCLRLKDCSQTYKQSAAILHLIFRAYEYLDHMQYDQAYALINSICNEFADPPDEKPWKDMQERTLEDIFKKNIHNRKVSAFENKDFVELLRKQKAFLEEVKQNYKSENLHNLTDLSHNMCRAFDRGNYADVPARFLRLREGMLYYRLETLYGINVRHVEESKNKDNVRKLENSEAFSDHIPHEGPFKKMYQALFVDILTFLGDETLRKFEDLHNDWEMKQVRYARNQTYIGYGMGPARKEYAYTCLELAKEILPLIPDSEDIQKDYPFKKENMDRLIDLLIRV
jgi:hypothetical protein